MPRSRTSRGDPNEDTFAGNGADAQSQDRGIRTGTYNDFDIYINVLYTDILVDNYMCKCIITVVTDNLSNI